MTGRSDTDPIAFIRRNPTVATTYETRCSGEIAWAVRTSREKLTKVAIMLAGTPFLRKSMLDK